MPHAQGMAAPARADGQDPGNAIHALGSGRQDPTCGDNAIHVTSLVLLAEEVWSGSFQLFVIAGHHCHMVDPVGGQMLPRDVEMWSRYLTQQ